MIWGNSGVILECRITVCSYSVELSIQKSQTSTLIGCVYWFVTRFELSSIYVFHISITDPITIDHLNQFFLIINTSTIHLPLCLQNPHRRVVGWTLLSNPEKWFVLNMSCFPLVCISRFQTLQMNLLTEKGHIFISCVYLLISWYFGHFIIP